MKSSLVVLAIAALAMPTFPLHAADAVLSPRAREVHYSARTMAGTTVGQGFQFARSKANEDVATAISTNEKSAAERDLVREERAVVYSGKNAPEHSRKSSVTAPAK